MADEFLTISELAGWLDIREREIAKLVQARSIPYRRIGKALRFRRSHIEVWLTTLEGMDAVRKVPAHFSDPRSVPDVIQASPEVTTPTALPFTRGARRQVPAPSAPKVREIG